MNKHSDRLHFLYHRYINRSCTYEEMQELFAYVADPEWNNQLEVIAGEHLERLQMPERLPEIEWDHMYQQIITAGDTTVLNGNNRRGMIRWLTGRRMAAAAIIFILLTAGGYLWLNRSPKIDLATTDKKPAATVDIAPGGNKAILTLADNSTVILDSAANGAIAQQGNAKVVKLSNGQLMYQSAIPDKLGQAGNRQSAMTYNTLSTPRGGQYQLVLPDGSKVWLNAASSITYPTAFTGNERKVQITGEAYFEVTHNSQMPFVVEKGSMAVEVLGTHFNINAYDDEEAMKTTLLEGKVKVGSRQWAVGSEEKAEGKEHSVILKPGEQVSLSHSSQLSQPIPVQTDEVMAWKNGLFQFENADIRSVMRQLSRWYDVEIAYKQPSELKDKVSIEFPRSFNLSDVLKIMESTAGVKLQMEGKKIIVL